MFFLHLHKYRQVEHNGRTHVCILKELHSGVIFSTLESFSEIYIRLKVRNAFIVELLKRHCPHEKFSLFLRFIIRNPLCNKNIY